MKQCPRCNRNYADEALSYCLEDGERLVKKYDPDATMINPHPPSPIVPPTVAYVPTPAATPIQPRYFTPSAPAPEPGRRSPLVVGILVVIALAVGLTIGGVIFQRSSSNSPSSPSVVPGQDPVATHTTSPTPSPVSTTSTPAPQVTTVDSSNSGQPPAAADQQCVLYNDKSDKTVVNVREGCDARNCESDASTIAGEYPDNTPVRVFTGSNVTGSRFTWVKVMITSTGRIVWVASTKLKCT